MLVHIYVSGDVNSWGRVILMKAKTLVTQKHAMMIPQ